MHVCKTINEYKQKYSLFSYSDSIGFIPTMGHLHDGHLSLVNQSLKENNKTIVSIFVNPTQFNDKQDYESYPDTLNQDIKLLENANIDILFYPSYAELFLDNYNYRIIETLLSLDLEGEYRDGHFDGVLTVVMKLLNIIKPSSLYLGEKDYQQYLLIKNMILAFHLDINVILCPTIRLPNGLAMSSRNSKLSQKNKEKAALFAKYLRSNLSIEVIINNLEKNNFSVEYIQEKYNRRFGAVWLNKVRLIDNVALSDLTQTT